jgi:hypothetical protein
MIVTRATRNKLLKELLPGLEKLFGTAYEKHRAPEYIKRHRYGKYSIYRWDYDNPLGERRSTTLATGLDKDAADGMMKLLKEPQ